jgi:phosphatidylinositol-3-phosphatase
MRRMRATSILCAVAAGVGLACASAQAATVRPPVKHVWIIVLENQDYETSFGPKSPAPYLSKTLPTQGELLTHYYGTGHESLDNYVTMVSGQPPNVQTQADCQFYTEFAGSVGSDGVAVGQGCVYPPEVKTIADQLEAKGLTWKGYMEDMGKGCSHPDLNARDNTQSATKDSQYATRHNPFVYFHSIIDRPICQTNDVDLSALQPDLAQASTTPSYSFITPDLCNDGHDANCADGGPGGLPAADAFLKTWVPRITGSPAYADGGLLIVTFDEAEDDASDCCGEPMSPNTPNNGGPTQGNGGGRIGAVLLSPFIKPGSVNDTPYNHYSLLRSTEDMFGLPHLAYAAQDGLKPFEDDVFNKGPNGTGKPPVKPYPKPKVTIKGVPKRCVRKKPFTVRVKVKSKHLRRANAMVDRKVIGHSAKHSFKVKVKTKGLRKGNHLFSVRARDAAKRTTRKTVRFKVCK